MRVKELSNRQLDEVAQHLAEAAAAGGRASISMIFNKLGLPSSRPNLSKDLPDLWAEVVRHAYSGASKRVGHGSNAITILLEIVAQAFPGNTQLANFAHSMATATPRNVSKGEKVFFLSYASADIGAIGDLRARLLTIDPTLNIFMAHKKMIPDDEWLNTLREKLDSASVFIAWITPNYSKSPFCNFEIGLAQAADARLMPIIVEQVNPLLLPPSISMDQCYKFSGNMRALAMNIIEEQGQPA